MNDEKTRKVLIGATVILVMGLIVALFINRNEIKYDNSFGDDENLLKLKQDLAVDEEFIKLSILDLSQPSNFVLIRGLLLNLDTEKLLQEESDYKLSREDFNLAFLELYGKKINQENINQYTPRLGVSEKNGNVYFNTDEFNYSDNIIFIGIKSLNKRISELTADVIIYETYTNDFEIEEKIKNEIDLSIVNDTILSKEIIDTYNIKTTNKKITFKKVANSKYFKYQIINNVEGKDLGLLKTDEEGYFGSVTLIVLYVILGIVGAICLGIILHKVRNSNQ